MNKSDKLKKIIEFALERGYPKDTQSLITFQARSMGKATSYGWMLRGLLLSPDFAKAVFGEREVNPIGGYTATFRTVNPIKKCEYHLQQAVISKDLIDYYYKYVKEK